MPKPQLDWIAADATITVGEAVFANSFVPVRHPCAVDCGSGRQTDPGHDEAEEIRTLTSTVWCSSMQAHEEA
jgi:hypothetical protein